MVGEDGDEIARMMYRIAFKGTMPMDWQPSEESEEVGGSTVDVPVPPRERMQALDWLAVRAFGKPVERVQLSDPRESIGDDALPLDQDDSAELTRIAHKLILDGGGAA